MKGLLLKDFYMLKKYCKTYLLLVLVFLIASFYDSDNWFCYLYPCIFAGIIPITLLGYDERSKWNEYCSVLPYTKTQIVSSKYLMGIFIQVIVVLLFVLSITLKMCISGLFNIKALLSVTSVMICVFLCSTAFCLPFMFKFGVEKGRLAYFFMIGASCAVASALAISQDGIPNLWGDGINASFVLLILSVGLYALSWYLSVAFYQKREI